jgi:hypothetical protein
MFLPANKTEIAQNAARLLVSAGAASAATHAVDEFTDIDTDDNKIVEIACGAFGYYVGLKCKPVTDAAVEKAANTLSRIKFRKKNVETPDEQ